MHPTLRVKNKRKAKKEQQVRVKTAGNNIITSTHTADLDILNLPKEATQTHVIPEHRKHLLLSKGKMCDHGCEACFNATEVIITCNNKTVITGERSDETHGLYVMNYPPTGTANFAVNQSAKPADIVAFAHAALFSPAITTLQKALEKNYIALPGLTLRSLKKYPPRSKATAMGHLDQVHQNKKSTKKILKHKERLKSDPFATENMESLKDAFPTGLE